ncbi:hypothetical protein [Paracoccus sp. (in: a-proteobacteria)]|uniref:hypothetical protein n=1 Tax=Paracoccus sp. TaxID=267 RepID=UPI00396CF760
MRGDMMRWIGRLVAVVFGLGLVALLAMVVVLVRRAEGVPPMPIFMGLLGAVVLILVSGACLALISIAVSARRGIVALEQIAAGTPAGTMVQPEEEPEPEMQGPFSPTGLHNGMVAPQRPLRAAGRRLVVER